MRGARILARIGLALILAACGAKPAQPAERAPLNPAHFQVDVLAIQEKPVSVAKQLEGQTGVTRLLITPRGFEPQTIRVPLGGRVKIHLINQTQRVHNLVINRFGIVTHDMSPGEENYIEFTASARGEWPFISDAGREPGDPIPGYTGTLKVE